MKGRNWLLFLGILIALVILIVSCETILPDALPENQLLDGPIDGLTAEQHARFIAGDAAFNNEIFTPQKGLGPLFVATSCGSCHAGDGKGHPFSSLTRFGQSDASGNNFLDQGGPQLQHRSIPGFVPEALPEGATFTKLVPPSNTGLGLLEAVSDADMLSHADPLDADGDGISGVPNWIPLPDFVIARSGAMKVDEKYIGRFGKKGAVYDLLQQTVNAYNQDIGITSSFQPHDTYSGFTQDPEVSDQTIRDVVFYLETLKAPLARNQNVQEIVHGKDLFMMLNCGKCHVPELHTGESHVAALSNKTIFPYTDLLLHDMGAGLDDGYTEGSALTSEWRTPPLWGLGLSKYSQGGGYFLLHDGRAHSIEQAILFHGGEASASKTAFELLSVSDRAALIKFLESL